MEQYINKTVVLAQANIEITNCHLAAQQGILTEFGKGKLEGLEGIVDFINNLEVKNVDLEKEISTYMSIHHLKIQDGGRILFNNGDTPNFPCDFRDIAKHFFELGMRVNNPITAADRGTADEIIINLKC